MDFDFLDQPNPEIYRTVSAILYSRKIWSEIGRHLFIFVCFLVVGKFLFVLYRLRSHNISRNKPRRKQRSIAPNKNPPPPDIARQLDPSERALRDVRRPKHAYRVRDRKRFCSEVAPGQHYAVRRLYGGYPLYHHFIIVEATNSVARVIHYNGEFGKYVQSAAKIFGTVSEENIDLSDTQYFDIPDNFYRILNPAYQNFSKNSDEVISRAKARLGECMFGITFNNCEHFARWAMTGESHCEQYDSSAINEKVLGAIVDEIPNVGIRLSMKLLKEVLYGLCMGIEQYILQDSARLIQHTASVTVASLISTSSATLGFSTPAEAIFLSARILSWKYHYSHGKMSYRDYKNAKDKAITGCVFSLICAAFGAAIGQFAVPIVAVGPVVGSFIGGLVGRIWGVVMASYVIAIKEHYYLDERIEHHKLKAVRQFQQTVQDWKKSMISSYETISIFKLSLLPQPYGKRKIH